MKFDYLPKHGDFFVSLGGNYKDATIVQAFENKDDNNKLYGAYRDDEKAEYIKKPIEEYQKPLFPFFSVFREHRKELDLEFDLYITIKKKVEDFLLERENYSALFNEIENHLVETEGLDKENAVAILKVLAADNFAFEYKLLKSGEYLSFSKLKSRYQKSIKYYGSLADELKIKSDKISLLVSHSQSVGNFREFILRTLLKKWLPSKFSVATGFIEGFARQLDIIIYDSHNFSPSFMEGELVVIQQEAVRGVIEVKTTLNSTSLFEALEMFHEISLPGFMSTRLPIFKGVFAFDTEYVNTASIVDIIHDFYNKPYYSEQLKTEITRNILYLYHEITCVCVMKRHCIIAQYNYVENNEFLLPVLISVEDDKGNDIQTATFLSQLFGYLDVEYYAKKSSIWNFSRLVSSSTKVKLQRKLAVDDWVPRALIGHKGDQTSIKFRHELFGKWFKGEIDTTEFIKSFQENVKP